MRILVFILCFVGSIASAQEVVRISPEASRWFMEQADKVQILTKKDSLNTTIIENLNFTISTKNTLIKNLDTQVDIQEMMLKVRGEEVVLRDEEIGILKKRIKREKLKSTVTVIASGVFILILI